MFWCIFFLLLYKYWFSELLTVDGSSAPRVVRVYKRQSIFSVLFIFLFFSVTMHNLMLGNFSRRSERHLVCILCSQQRDYKKIKKEKQRMKMDVNLYFSRTVTVWLMRFRITPIMPLEQCVPSSSIVTGLAKPIECCCLLLRSISFILATFVLLER